MNYICVIHLREHLCAALPRYHSGVDESLHAMTIRFPDEVYEALRRASFDQRRPMSKIIIEATAAALGEDEAEVPANAS